MSLVGNAESGYTLRGKLSGLEKINGLSAYEVAVANGFVGTEEEWLASLEGRDGADGKDGTEIASFGRTAGSGLPGTKDTYTMNMSDGRNYQFDVYNGADGSGAGDMTAAVYDPDGAVASKGGISSYVDGKISAIPTPDVSGQIGTHNNDTAAHADIRAELATKTNPNLLHNWYFANPVNQRGQTEYTGAGYTIDRWKTDTSANVLVLSDGLTIENVDDNGLYFYQPIEHNLLGETVTVSILTDSGIFALTRVMTTDLYSTITPIPNVGWIGCRANTDGTSGAFIAVDAGKSIKVKAAKLELGSTQTLAHQDADGNWVLNEIPDYGEELRKCQRYQVELNCEKFPYAQIGNGNAYSNTVALVLVPLPQTLGKTPVSVIRGNWCLTNNHSSYIPAKHIAVDWWSANGISLRVETDGGLTSGETYTLLAANDSSASLILDANL